MCMLLLDGCTMGSLSNGCSGAFRTCIYQHIVTCHITCYLCEGPVLLLLPNNAVMLHTSASSSCRYRSHNTYKPSSGCNQQPTAACALWLFGFCCMSSLCAAQPCIPCCASCCYHARSMVCCSSNAGCWVSRAELNLCFVCVSFN
jgi:hypothetical protein